MQERVAPTLPSTYRYGFVAALALAFIYLLLRNGGVYPMVFADEWLYSSSARLQPLAKSTLPSYLYLALFGQTNMCGPGFLECARMLNALLFVGAAPILYLLARPVCGARLAAVLAVLCLFGPINSYTVYFMPEAMYFLGFCIFAWAALRGRDLPPLRYGVLTGAVLGVLSVVKVHALFLLPALLAYMLYLCASGPAAGRWTRLLRMALVAPLVMLAVKASLGYLLAGADGVQLFGSFYGNNHGGDPRGLARLLAPGWLNLRGHLMGLVLLLGLPLGMLLWQLASRQGRAQATPALRDLQVFALLALGAALGMAVLYTASIAEQGPTEGWRLHMRYYNFVFPLLLIVAAAPLAKPAEAVSAARWPRLLAVAVVGAGIVYAYFHLQPAYLVSYIDSPELMMMTRKRGQFAAGVALQLLMLGLWVWRPRWSALLLVGLLLPVLSLYSESGIRTILQRQRVPEVYDRAALLARNYLPREELAQLTVAGEGAGLLRALFHLDTPGADFIELKPGAPLAANEVPPRRRWLLVVGQHELAPELQPVVRTPDFALLRVRAIPQSLLRADFNEPLDSGLLSAAEGLANPEHWGAWSVAKQVKLEFAQPLPKQARLILRASTFGPNLEQDFQIIVGGQSQRFRLQGKVQDRLFEFNTDGATRSVVIEVPQPASPLELGQGNDDRKLGLALTSIELGKP
ncbi:DUF7024 domain-containing protein [Pseudoduganella violacea]|uniref:Phosphoglycerol transferase n=1 Tax=Pseudoduganella violacea TaxID=1715466 RepID=A0A7W5FST5_9BURK|nr:glycosyltransferase family 39 protein [Pseudoduganella violacea]MBB3118070.1 phosphoglycerol transferase [Pseudoduganella violacea]